MTSIQVYSLNLTGPASRYGPVVASAFLLPFAPWRLDARHPRMIEDLLEIARSHDPTVIAAMIDMLEAMAKEEPA